MARRCAICGRVAQSGSNISHAHNVTKRKFRINLQTVRVKVGGRVKKMLVCTKCIRSGKVMRP